MSWHFSAGAGRRVAMARPNPRRSHRLLLETLEDRLAPATFAYDPVADALVITGLSGASTNVAVSTPSTNLVQIAITNSDTFTSLPPSGDFVLSNANRTLQINTAPANSPLATFQMTFGSAGDFVTFGLGGSGITSTGVGSVTINTGGGTDAVTLNTVNITGSLSVTGGTVYIPATATITTQGNDISLTGQGNTLGYVGVNVNGATLDSGGGNIQLTGTGGGTTNFNFGVEIWNGAQVRTSGTGAVNVTGTGGTSTGYVNAGIHVASASTQISAGAGGISLTGYGKGSGTTEVGVDMLGGTVAATLSGDVTINGYGSTSGSGTAYGAYISGATVRTQDGDVTITGTGGGTGAAASNHGISIKDGAVITATGIGAVSLNGAGGTTTGSSNIGISVAGTPQISAGTGGVSLVGTGNGSGSYELGVRIMGGTVSATLTGDVAIQGTGGTSSSGIAYGVLVTGSGAVVSSQDGDVTITGTGGGTASAAGNVGVGVTSGAVVAALGIGAVQVNGLGGNTSGANDLGIFVSGGGTQINAGTGGVSLSGTGNGSGINEHGVNISGGTVAATLSGDVSIDGHGGTSASDTAYGVFLNSGSAVVNAVDGNVVISGTGGGTGAAHGNVGVSIGNGAAIAVTGAGAVQLNGTGGNTPGDDNLGIFIYSHNGDPASIAAGAGGVSITGTANGSGNDEWGVQVSSSTVATTLSGDIVIQGTGSASGVQGNDGVFLGYTGTNITSTDGNITITGNGAGSASDNIGLAIADTTTVAALGAGKVTLRGTGGNGTHDNYGVSLSGSGTVVLTGGGALSITGTGQGAGAANYGITADSGAVKTLGAGALTLTGTASTADTPAIYFTDTASIQAGTGPVTLTGDEIDLGDAGTVAGAGNFLIQPADANRGVILGGAADVSGALTLTDADAAALAAGFSSITIGAGSGGMAIDDAVSVPGTLTLTTTGAIAGAGSLAAGSLTLNAGAGIGSAATALTITASSLSATGGSAPVFVHDTTAVALAALSTVASAPSGTAAVDVQGAATLDPATSTLTLAAANPTPAVNSVYTILHTTAGVSGQFNGLPQGAFITIGGNRYQISYQANGGNDVTLTRLANAATHLLITTPTQAVAGGLFTVTVLAADANGDADPFAGGTIQLVLTSAPASGKLSGVLTATMKNGIATFGNLSLNVVGSNYTIVAAGNGILPPALSSTITVVPTTHFSLSGIPSKLTAGASFNLTITALDAKNLTDGTYHGTVRLTSTDPQVVFSTGPLVTLAAGTATVNVTLKTVGNRTITAVDTTKSTMKVTGPATNVTTVTTPTGFSVTGFLSPTLVGAPHNFTVTAVDDYGNKIAGYKGTVQFSSSAVAVLPTPYTFTAGDGGKHTFSAKLGTVGLQSLTATDKDSTSITGTLADINVVNLTAGVTGLTAAIPKQSLTYTLSALGEPAGTVFTYKIDWDGNNTVDQTVSGPSGLQVSHVYPAAGNFNIHVTATDKVGNVSPKATRQVGINAVAVEPVPANPAQSCLYVCGTSGNDTISLDPTTISGQDAVSVTLNGKVLQAVPSASLAYIVVYGLAGMDNISTQVDVPALLFAGSGTTTLSALDSSANNVLVGGTGSTTLIGGHGKDILISGKGAAALQAGNGGDLLIGGSTSYDANVTALLALIAEWGRSGVDYTTRVQDLYGVGTGGLNDGYTLTPQTVVKSTKVEWFTAGPGMDWFWIKATDQFMPTVPLQIGEVVTML